MSMLETALHHVNDSDFERGFDAFLFDMDGTLLDSIAVAERVWGQWAVSHGLDASRFVPTIHGKRGHETIAALALPGVDPIVEADKINAAELLDVEGVVAIRGAAQFLRSLPADRWAVVTSAPKALALVRLAAAGLPMPPTLITAEDVTSGKPNPECFMLAATRLGFDPGNCIVFEDAAAGIEAGEAAGATVVVIAQTHRQPMATPHRIVRDYSGITTKTAANGQLVVVFSS